MSTTTYECKLTFTTFRFRANLAENSAPITVSYDDNDGEFVSTRFQTADARHSERKAAELLIADCGRDWWLDPSDAARLEEIGQDEYIRGLIRSVSAVD